MNAKKIVVIASALIFLIGSGVGGYMFFVQKGGADDHAENSAPPPPAGPPMFVEVGPIILPVMGEKRVEQNVLLVVAVEVDGEQRRNQVRDVKARLADAFITTLYGSLGKDQVIEGQVVDVVGVKAKLIAAADKVLGKGVARDILIQAVNQRPAF